MWTPGPAKGVFLLLQVRVCHAILGGNSHRIGVKRQPPSSPLFPLSSCPSLGSEAGTQFHAVITLLSLHCLFKIYIYLFIYLAVLGLSGGTGPLSLWHMGSGACGFGSCSVQAKLLSGMWDLSSPTRDWTCIPCTERKILSHWITREVPHCVAFYSCLKRYHFI